MSPQSPDISHWLESLLAAIPQHLRQRPLYLALSGGLDSTVLLSGLLALRQAGKIGHLQALHVHHGLQAQADAWAERARQLGARLEVPLRVLQVEVNLATGQGVEAAARDARYAAFAEVMAAGEVLLTAHHLDDQAETFLLQLMRGAGVRGLAAMPVLQPFALREGDGWHLRPLLSMSRKTLHSIALELGLEWVDDPSNADPRFARNYLRHAVVPSLMTHWPLAAQTLARCAQRMANTESLLLDLARLDLQQARCEDPRCLDVDALQRLSVPRMQNAVRAWLLELALPPPPEARLNELRRVLDARADALPQLAWPGGILRRWRGGLYASAEQQVSAAWSGCSWSLLEPLELPTLGVRLVAQPRRGCGLQAALVAHGVQVCTRHAAALPAEASRRHLSKRLQELGVPPWLRARLPLIYLGSSLLQIGDLWLSPAHRAQADEDGMVVSIEHLG